MESNTVSYPYDVASEDVGLIRSDFTGTVVSPARGSYTVHPGMPRLSPSPLYTAFKRRIPEPAFYAVPALMWLLLSFRHGSATLPSAANPRMEAGGLWGESKTQGMGLFGPLARRFMPRTVSFEVPCDGCCGTALDVLQAAGLSFPLVAKPDRGYQGWGVRSVQSAEDLGAYFEAMPAGSQVLLQEQVSYPGEAGIFYIRHPDEAHGRIYSMTLVHSPHVVGDGVRPLAELVEADPVLRKSKEIFKATQSSKWPEVPEPGEVIVLAQARSARLGAVYRDARHHVTRVLERRIDEIARDIPGFHFGRFDIRFASLDRLKDGEDFCIVELNGAGAEILRIWDGRTRLVDAYRGLWNQYRTLFSIAAANRAAGCRPAGLADMVRLLWRQETLRKIYPPSC